jgi:hypothetical protein
MGVAKGKDPAQQRAEERRPMLRQYRVPYKVAH